ncbi:MAG: DUF421 domain-containing protein [Oscillospiraceae bacterium]|nr:DUF421 domain-containing protein [Oscillospiraceae bacterium]
MAILFIRSVIVYLFIIFSVRIMGKRQIGELQPSELVVTILVSNIATLPVEDVSVPLFAGLIPVAVLVCLDVIMSGITLKSRRIRGIVSGNPKVIIKDGVIDQKVIKELRFTADDILEALHGYGIFDVSEVHFAIAETTGKISVLQKFSYRTPVNSDMNIKGKDMNPPAVIINDGVLIEDALSSINKGEGWLEKVLKEKNLRRKDIFLMTCDKNEKINIIKKEK